MSGAISRLRAHAASVMSSSPFLGHVLTLMTGAAVAQGVTFVMKLVLARIYTPEQMGHLGTYTAVAAVVVAVAALRYDMAIMLPKEEAQALSVARLALWCIVVVSGLTTALAIPLRGLAAEHWGPQVAAWLPLLGLTTLLMAGVELMKYWFNRHSDYRVIAINQAEQQIGLTGGQLILGLTWLGGLPGLILGHTAGQLFAFLNLGRQAPELRRPLPDDAPRLRWAARRYRRMPLLNAPNALVDAVRTSGIQLLIVSYSAAALGQFQLAWGVLDAPLILINGAVSRVFFQKLSAIEPGQMRPLVRSTIRRAILIGVVPFALIYLLSPWLFPFFFGDQWDQAGDFARAMTPWLFMLLITSPISNLFVVTEHQDWLLGFSILYTAAPLAWLALSPLDLLATSYILGALMGGLLVLMTLMADLAAGHFDRSPRRPGTGEDDAEGGGEDKETAR